MVIHDLTKNDASLKELLSLISKASQMEDPLHVQRVFGDSMRDLAGASAYMALSVRNCKPGEFKITRTYIDGKPFESELDPWTQWEQIPVRTGGILGSLISTPRPKVADNIDLTNEPGVPSVYHKNKSAFAFPLFDNGQALNWGVMFREVPVWEQDASRLRDFILRANMLGQIVNLLVTNERVADLNLRLADQLEQVASLQRSLLPARTPIVPGVEIATSYLTSNEAGGDYYDFFDMDNGKLGVLIADVSGHGAGAATVMAMLRTILHGYQDRKKGPAEMLEHANRELLRNDLNSNFVTAFMVEFDPQHNRVRYSNAGHNPPVLRLTDGRHEEVDDARSLPLGIIDDAEYEMQTKPVESGVSVMMYTDGITEAFSPPPTRDMFGVHRLASAIGATTGAPQEMIDAVHKELYAHTGTLRARDDDQTLVALRHRTD